MSNERESGELKARAGRGVGGLRPWVAPLVFACALSLLLVCALSSCGSPPVQETVTTDAGRRPSDAVEARPVINDAAQQLPARDAELEQLGDHIAEAITHLHKKRSTAALRALAQAEATTHHALRNDRRDARTRDALSLTLRDLEVAGRTIQRGALDDARKQLHALNQRLDGLDPSPTSTSNQ